MNDSEMTVCYCTQKNKGYIQKLIEERVTKETEFSNEIISKIHHDLCEGDEEIGRCFGCFDEIEEMVFDHIRELKK